jgi:hypothetical protein
MSPRLYHVPKKTINQKEWHIATKRLKNKLNLAVLTPGGHIQADPSSCWFQIPEQVGWLACDILICPVVLLLGSVADPGWIPDPGSRILIFILPGSRIQQQQKRGEGIILGVATNVIKLEIILFLNRKKFTNSLKS